MLTTPIAQCDCETATNDQTEALAKGIVESLFVGWTPTESVAPSFPVKSSKPLSARKLDMDMVHVDPVGFETAPPPETIPINQEEEEEDTWDTIDEETLSRQVQELKLTAAATAKAQAKKPINYFEAPPPSWDPMGLWFALISSSIVTVMPHVLEAHSIPEYKMQEDVVQALEEMGYGMSTVKWVERKIVFVSFISEKQGTIFLFQFWTYIYSKRCLDPFEASVATSPLFATFIDQCPDDGFGTKEGSWAEKVSYNRFFIRVF